MGFKAGVVVDGGAVFGLDDDIAFSQFGLDGGWIAAALFLGEIPFREDLGRILGERVFSAHDMGQDVVFDLDGADGILGDFGSDGGDGSDRIADEAHDAFPC